MTLSRDTQELLPEAGQEMLQIFSSHPATTFLLQDLAFFMVSLYSQLQPSATSEFFCSHKQRKSSQVPCHLMAQSRL